MKKRSKLILTAAAAMLIPAVMALTSGCEPKTFDLPLTENGDEYLAYEGKSNYVIVYPENGPIVLRTAAEQLQKYLKLITGYKFAVVSDKRSNPRETEICLGATNREKAGEVDRSGIVGEGFTVARSGKRVFITGIDPESSELFYGRGTLYGVYDFLESLGCGFFAVDTETVPRADTLTLPLEAGGAYTDNPAFEYRDLYWSCSYDSELSTKLRLNGCLGNRRELDGKYGSGLYYAGPFFVHTFQLIINPDEYGESHPEYFSEIDGVRRTTALDSQLCLTNPEVLEIAKRTVRKWLADDPKAKIVSVSQNDAGVIASYCTCENCRAVNEEEGSPAGTLIRFVNAIADDIAEDYPDVAVDTLAYQFSTTPPKLTRPRPNVIVRYCTGGCTLHPLGTCGGNSGIAGALAEWGKICDRIYIWDYTTDFARYLIPYMNLDSLAPNIRFFHDNGVLGVFEQGMYQEGNSGEFGELRCYLMARLLWDPDADVEALTEKFMEAYYGPGWANIRTYFTDLTSRLKGSGRHMNLVADTWTLYNGIVDQEAADNYKALWDNAETAEGITPVQLSHVKRSRLSFDYMQYELSLNGMFGFADEWQEFYRRCVDLGVKRLSEGQLIPGA
ncbi:MAG: DUF4838 domain-containing protein [Clostridia bacterium]|nr:DUF4838 domain-containing protein [Clostridia bacterium]